MTTVWRLDDRVSRHVRANAACGSADSGQVCRHSTGNAESTAQSRMRLTGSEESAPMSRLGGPAAGGDDLGAEDRDHRAVVGAQGGPRRTQRDPVLRRPLGQQRAQPAVGRHPAADQQVRGSGRGAGVHGLGAQHVADRLLEAGGDVGQRDLQAVPLARLDPAGHRGLHPGEGEVEAVPVLVLAARSARAGRPRTPGRRSPPGRCADRPDRAARAPGPPCRTPRRRRRRWSSRVR